MNSDVDNNRIINIATFQFDHFAHVLPKSNDIMKLLTDARADRKDRATTMSELIRMKDEELENLLLEDIARSRETYFHLIIISFFFYYSTT